MLRFFTLFPGALGVVVSVTGAVALVIWQMGLEVYMIPDSVLRPITALSFTVAGIALLTAQRRGSPLAMGVSRALATVVAAAGMFVMIEYALRAESIDHMLGFSNAINPATGIPFRMSLNSALGFAFFGQGLLFLHRDRRRRGLASQVFGTLTLIVAFIALVGHLFGVRDFYTLQLLSGMSISAAVTFVLLATGLVFSQLERGIPALIVDDGAAGFVARRLLPGALLVPFALGMLGALGEERGFFGHNMGASLVAVADMVVFLLLIAWSARVVREVDWRRGELFIREREAAAASELARSEAETAMQQAEAARAEAESANGAKSDFLAVMSHELRTPLAAIMGYQELLADGITGPVTEAQSQQLGRIKASARHLLSLIDEILTLTRLDAGRETILREAIDLETELRGAIQIVEPLAETKKIELRVVSPGPGVMVESDPMKIRQILVNLISNAVKFTDAGSVTAEAKLVGPDFQLIVRDTGIGIQPENINRIFDPFWQVEQTATRRATGTGLGLTVTKRLANLLSGDVTVTSTPGEGATFTVTLPAKAPQITSIQERGILRGAENADALRARSDRRAAG